MVAEPAGQWDISLQNLVLLFCDHPTSVYIFSLKWIILAFC